MFTELIHPITKQKLSLFSSEGRKLLKNYIKLCKSGGSGMDALEEARFIQERITLINEATAMKKIYIKIFEIFNIYTLELLDQDSLRPTRDDILTAAMNDRLTAQ